MHHNSRPEMSSRQVSAIAVRFLLAKAGVA